jgi:hypothetical protein
MAIHPDSRFPLLIRDQAEVIRIFLELMRESDRTGRAPKVTTTQRPIGRRNGPNDHWIPDELADLE